MFKLLTFYHLYCLVNNLKGKNWRNRSTVNTQTSQQVKDGSIVCKDAYLCNTWGKNMTVHKNIIAVFPEQLRKVIHKSCYLLAEHSSPVYFSLFLEANA